MEEKEAPKQAPGSLGGWAAPCQETSGAQLVSECPGRCPVGGETNRGPLCRAQLGREGDAGIAGLLIRPGGIFLLWLLLPARCCQAWAPGTLWGLPAEWGCAKRLLGMEVLGCGLCLEVASLILSVGRERSKLVPEAAAGLSTPRGACVRSPSSVGFEIPRP